MCTTHYSELKAFAFNTKGVENASVEFNVETLSPTYRLMIGVPGRSNAFAIASRLGLSHTIIDRARSYIDPTNQRVEDLMDNLRRQQESTRDEQTAAERVRQEVDEQRREMARRLGEIEEIKAQAAADARAEMDAELAALRDEMRRLRGRVEAGLAATSSDVLTRQELQEAQGRADEFERQLRTKAAQQKRRQANTPKNKDHAPHTLGPGDLVYVHSLGADGDVISGPDGSGQVEVQVGAFKMRVPLSGVKLRQAAHSARAARDQAATAGAGRYAPAAPTAAPPLESDFRGWRAEEAIEEMDRRLNDAALVGMPFLRIIHGKGTGALRKAMREYLKNHPSVKGIETAPIEQGGEGVTIVRL